MAIINKDGSRDDSYRYYIRGSMIYNRSEYTEVGYRMHMHPDFEIPPIPNDSSDEIDLYYDPIGFIPIPRFKRIR